MSNPNMESKVKVLLELKRMKEELEAEITSMEDEIKSVIVSVNHFCSCDDSLIIAQG